MAKSFLQPQQCIGSRWVQRGSRRWMESTVCTWPGPRAWVPARSPDMLEKADSPGNSKRTPPKAKNMDIGGRGGRGRLGGAAGNKSRKLSGFPKKNDSVKRIKPMGCRGRALRPYKECDVFDAATWVMFDLSICFYPGTFDLY